MPRAAERRIARQGGAKKYRTIKKNGRNMTCAITKRKGPRKGQSVCWKRS